MGMRDHGRERGTTAKGGKKKVMEWIDVQVGKEKSSLREKGLRNSVSLSDKRTRL